MKSLGKLLPAAALILSLFAGYRSGAAEPAPQWKTGAAFHQALAGRFDVVDWPAGSQLREILQRLSQLQGVVIMLDRRIDPSSSIRLTARDISLSQVLSQLAEQCDAAVSYIDAVVYIGPRDSTAGLSQVAQRRSEEARSLPRAAAARFS